mgnify:FL=1
MVTVTLIAAGRLDDRLLGEALRRVPGAAFASWIDEGDAADLNVADASEARAAFERWEGCDIIVDPPRRGVGLFVADMDSTMIGQECIDELADFAGVKAEVAAITERAMRGELDFASALSERLALLEGLAVGTVDRCLAERIRHNPGAATLVGTLAANGAHTLLVSGGFTEFVGPVAAALGFAEFRANRLGRDGARLSGKAVGPIVDGAAKRAALVEARARLGIGAESVVAIGDGANDLPMIAEAGLGVAFRAKPVVAAAADARLDHHPLDALLWAFGLPRRAWVEA